MRHDENINQLLEATAYDRDGERIGNVSGVYLDDHSGEPMWVTVNTGFFGLSSSFAPLAGSSLDGDRLTLAAEKAAVKDAPNIDEDGHITREQEDELYRYYQVDSAELDADVMRTRRWGHEGTAAGGLAAGGLLDRDADGREPVGEVLDGPDHDRYDDNVEGGGLLDPDADGQRPLGEVMDGPEHDRFGDHVEGGGLLDRDADGRGPLGEVLDGPDHDRYDDHVEGGGLLDRDADGRGPLGEVLDGPDDVSQDPAYRNDPSFLEDRASDGNERYVTDERLLDQRHDEHGLGEEFVDGGLSERPDAGDGPLSERGRASNPIDSLLDDTDDERPRNVN